MPIKHNAGRAATNADVRELREGIQTEIQAIVGQLSNAVVTGADNTFTFAHDINVAFENSGDSTSRNLTFKTEFEEGDTNSPDFEKLITTKIEIRKSDLDDDAGKLEIARKRDATDTDTQQTTTTTSDTVPIKIGLGSIEVGRIQDSELSGSVAEYHEGMLIEEPRWSRISNPGADLITPFLGDSGINLSGGTQMGSVLTLQRLLQNNEVISRFHAIVNEGGCHTVSSPAVVNGVPRSTNTYQTTFRNPITIHEHTHHMSFGTGQAAMVSNADSANAFTVNCESDFNNTTRLNDIPLYANQFFDTTHPGIVANVINSVTNPIIDNTTTFTKRYPNTASQSLTPGTNYKIRIKQSGASSQSGISDLDLTTRWTVPANNTSQSISVQESLPVCSSYSMSLHGTPELYYEIGNNGVWKLYLAFSHINGSYSNDSIPLEITFREENW
jgi:hypothetical protein